MTGGAMSQYPREARSRSRIGWCCVVVALLVSLHPGLRRGACAGASEPAAPRLRKITVLGLAPDRQIELREAVSLEPGMAVGQSEFDAVRTALDSAGLTPTRMGLTPAAAIESPAAGGEAASVDLVLDFRPPPRIASVSVHSLVPLPEGIADGVQSMVGEFLSPEAIQAQALQLRSQIFSRTGHQVVVTPYQSPATASTLDIGFVLEDPNYPVLLEKLRFEGTGLLDILNRSAIVKSLKSLEPVPFAKGTTVTTQRLLEIAPFAQTYYIEQGYLDARVYLESTQTDAEDKTVELTCRIARGSSYDIAETRVAGNRDVSSELLHKIASLYDGKRFNGQRYREIRRELARGCMSEGYMGPKVSMDYRVNPDEQTVTLIAEIDEGAPSTLGSVEVIHHSLKKPRRNPRSALSRLRNRVAPPLDDNVILRQVQTQPGDPLDLSVVEETAQRVESFGSLEDVKVDTKPTDDPAVRDLVIDVTDKRSGRYDITGAWARGSDALGVFQISEENMGGVGDRLSFQTSSGRERFLMQFSYLDRNWKLGDRLLGYARAPSLETRLYLSEGWYKEYTQSVMGATMELRFNRLDPRSRWNDMLRLRLDNVSLIPRQAPENYAERFDDYIAASLTYQLSHDTRNRGDLSTKGAYIGTSLELGSADGLLCKFVTRYERYQTFFRSLTWALRGQLGLMPYDADQIGIGERFQSGGHDNLRGFEWRGVGPVDALEKQLHTGGSTQLLLSNELRWQMTDRIMPLLFCDLGNLGYEAFTPGEWNASAGAGLRFMIPGTENEAFLYYSAPLIDHETDVAETFQFGVRFALPKRSSWQ